MREWEKFEGNHTQNRKMIVFSALFSAHLWDMPWEVDFSSEVFIGLVDV